MTENGWNEYQRMVLGKLDDLKEEQRRQGDVISKMRTDIATLQVKAGVWGGIAGLIPFGLFLVTKLLGGH